MTRDRSLEEFATGSAGDDGTDPDVPDDGSEPTVDDDSEPTADDDSEPTADDGSEPRDVDDPDPIDTGRDAPVEPLSPTYQWSPAERPCGVCGDDVAVRWRADGELVCEACKEW